MNEYIFTFVGFPDSAQYRKIPENASGKVKLDNY